MRQIKFRGKDRKTGKWVFGDLLAPITGSRIVNYREEDNGSMKRADYNYHDVLDDTIGQFIGLRDRNGKEIYEGDIVRISVRPTLETQETNEHNARLMGFNPPSWFDGGDTIGRVSFFDTAFHFITISSYLPGFEGTQEPMLQYLFGERHPDEELSYTQEITVVGNIHDNPELLTPDKYGN